MKTSRDEDFDRGTPLFWCPYCQVCPAWLTEIQRDAHIMKKHWPQPLVAGDGIQEWRERREFLLTNAQKRS